MRVNTGDESLIKRVLRAYIVCGACGNNRTNWAGFQFAAARLPGFTRARSSAGGKARMPLVTYKVWAASLLP